MRKLVSAIVLFIVVAMSNGCLLAPDPIGGNVTIAQGETKTFSVFVFPVGGELEWYLNGDYKGGGTSFTFSPGLSDEGDYTLTVYETAAFGQTKTWNLTVDSNLINNGGFETATDPDVAWPPVSDFGVWSGDLAQIVPAQDGITPMAGSNMLQFVCTGAEPGTTGESDLYQVIDLSAFTEDIATGTVSLTYTGNFNRVAGDAETDTEFGIEIYAFDDDAPDFNSPWGSKIVRDLPILTDADVETWEELTTTWLLPAGTTFLLIHTSATENITNDETDPEFDGHYADNLSLTLSMP